MAEPNIGQLNQQLSSNPRFQQAFAAANEFRRINPAPQRKAFKSDEDWRKASLQWATAPPMLEAAKASQEALGGKPPHDYLIGDDGQLQKKSFLDRNNWVFFAAALGGPAAVAALAPAAGAAAAGGAASSGSAAAPLAGTSLATGAAGAGTSGLGIGAGLPAVATAGGGLSGGAGVTGALTTGTSAASAGSRFANLANTGAKAASAFGQAETDNRGTALEALLDQDRTRLAAETDRRAGEKDALRGLAQTNYIQNWQPRTSSIQGLPTFGTGPMAPSEAQRTGAATLQQTLLDRLNSGGFQPTDVNDKLKPGKGERFAGLLGAGLSLYGATR